MRQRRWIIGLALALAWCRPEPARAQTVDDLVARNITARGGADAWLKVSSIRLTGEMDVGQGMRVPYVLEQKRPLKMRLEFVFDGGTAVQCSDGKTGWKVTPFRGRTAPERLTEQELREAANLADLDGLLFDLASRGRSVALVGRETVQGRDTYKLQVTLPGDVVRWLFVDAETGLEVRVDAMRQIGGRQQRVETLYGEWRAEGALLIPRRLETRIEGSSVSQLVTVESVIVNPDLDDARFVMPAPPPTGGGNGR